MICTTYFLTFFSELIPPTGSNYINQFRNEVNECLFEALLKYLPEDLKSKPIIVT